MRHWRCNKCGAQWQGPEHWCPHCKALGRVKADNKLEETLETFLAWANNRLEDIRSWFAKT